MCHLKIFLLSFKAMDVEVFAFSECFLFFVFCFLFFFNGRLAGRLAIRPCIGVDLRVHFFFLYQSENVLH